MTVYDINLIKTADELEEYLKYYHDLNKDDRSNIRREFLHIARNNIDAMSPNTL